MSTPIDLQYIIDLDSAATPGPWQSDVRDDESFCSWHSIRGANDKHVITVNAGCVRPPDANDDDADLISYYRDAAPAMAKILQELREMAKRTIDLRRNESRGQYHDEACVDIRDAILELTNIKP